MSDFQVPSITLEKVLESDQHIIDVRSPSEFEEFHLPNSENIPLFNDSERAIVGTAYKQESPEKAKEIGMQFFSKKLPDFYQKLLELNREEEKEIIITCARGGMRSGTFVSLMNSLDFPVKQLEGGVRSARHYVQAELDRFAVHPWKAIVIGGLTGTRKTIWLEKLHAQGYPVLNLEKLASHRGSIFGHIGMPKRSQKEFEWLLVKELQRLEHEDYILMEAESKRIGPVNLPEWLQEVKEYGKFIELQDHMDRRVKYLLEEYRPEVYEDSFKEALDRLKKRLKPESLEFIEEAETRNDYYAIFRRLLEYYYDPSYSHKQKGYIEKENKRYVNLSLYKEEDIPALLKKEIALEAEKV